MRQMNCNLQKYHRLPNILCTNTPSALSQGGILVSDLYWPHQWLRVCLPFQSRRFGIATLHLRYCLCVCVTSQCFTPWPPPPFAWSGMCNFSAVPAEQILRSRCWTCSRGHKIRSNSTAGGDTETHKPGFGFFIPIAWFLSGWLGG